MKSSTLATFGKWICVALLATASTRTAFAQQKPQRTSDAANAAESEEDRPAKFVPARPITVAEANAIEVEKLYVVGLMQLSNRRFTDALQTFKKALEKSPNHIGALREIVPLAFQLDKQQDAMEYCNRALQLEPDNPGFLQQLALRARRSGDLQAAITAFERACRGANVQKSDAAGYLQMKLELAQLYDSTKDAAKLADTLADIVQMTERIGSFRMREPIRAAHQRNLTRYRENYIRAAIASKRLDDAERQLQKALKEPSGRRLGIYLAEVLFERGKYSEALAELEKYRRLQMIEDRAPLLLEKIYAKMGRSGEYLATMEHWVRDDRRNPVLRRIYGEKLMAAKKYAEARSQLTFIKDKPEVVPLLIRLFREMNDAEQLLETLARSVAGVETGRNEMSADQFDLEMKAIGDDRELIGKIAAVARNPKQKMGVDPFIVNLLVAWIAKSGKQIDLAREFYDRCINERGRPEDYAELINLLFDAERYQDAEKYCVKAMARDPDEFDFRDMLVRSLGMQDKGDEAIAKAQEFVGKTADRDVLVRAILTLSWAYQNAGKFDKAIEAVQRVLDEFPGNGRVPYARYLLSNILTQKGDTLKAEEQLLKLAEGDEATIGRRLKATANNDLGYMWADRGHNLEKAEGMIRKALEIEPENGAYLDSLGWLLFKRGRHAEAKGYLEKAVFKHEDGNDPVIWDHLGDAQLQVGEKAQAKKSWEKALELFIKQKKIRDRDGLKARELQRKLEGLAGKSQAPQRAGKDDP